MRYSLHFGVTCNAKTPENRVIGCKRVLDQVQTGSGPGPPFFTRAWAEGPAPTHELMYAAPITFGQVMTFPFPPTLKCWSLYRGALVEETLRFFNNVCNTQALRLATCPWCNERCTHLREAPYAREPAQYTPCAGSGNLPPGTAAPQYQEGRLRGNHFPGTMEGPRKWLPVALRGRSENSSGTKTRKNVPVQFGEKLVIFSPWRKYLIISVYQNFL